MNEGLVGITHDKNIVDMCELHGDEIDLCVIRVNLPLSQEESALTNNDGALVVDDIVLDEGLIPTGLIKGSGTDDEANSEWDSAYDTNDDDFSGFDDS
ncbi:hypothetical protein RHMOL_Rhmol07G0053800 [Rhododendron molle]|uniref:Uncharacterized protein n=1 Tax=Rhododendron molle TaxID=49168 RepID=A0ACC0MX76_RHOML|nr:hypothetical protein RHMOL_Rhmol07G0053800 [Rhododendron molle]